ncbi:winged helix DNA-binding domain-containing protein [Thermoleophilia bacterium SCSIO 60948]|nr:winged helix DNA-binding domain-containing protein [Thermoleophilia bacterium SCSIO 60948]
MRTLDLVQSRLARQRLSSAPLDSPLAAVDLLLAVQAQEYEESKWSLSQRSGDPSEEEVEALIASGALLRTHIMRPTWHLVLPADIGWVQRLTGPRVHVANRASYNRVGHSDDDLRRADEAIAAALSDGEPRTRRELGTAIEAAGLEDCEKGERLTHAVIHAELECLIASGPRRGKQFTYLPVSEETRASGPSDDAALAELGRRYLRGHAPARARDLSWWSGLTLTQARRSFELLGDEIERLPGAEVTDAEAWWTPIGDIGTGAEALRRALLLGSFDESHIAYREPRAVTRVDLRLGFDFERPVLLDGEVVAGWRRVRARDAVEVTITPFAALSRAKRALIRAEAERFARFLGLELELVVAEPGMSKRR